MFGLKQNYQFLRRETIVNDIKTLIWIDDRADDMEQIVRGAFCELWKEKIFSKTVFLGDFIQEVSEEDCSVYGYTVREILFDLCRDYGVIDPSRYKEDNSNLKDIYDKCKTLFDSKEFSTCIYDKKDEEFVKKIHLMIQNWKAVKSTQDVWDDNFVQTKNDLKPDDFFKLIENPEKFVYALDIVLLKGDESKLNCDINDSAPILSIELYHYITQELKCKCLLYSRYTNRNRLANNWKELYLKRHKKECDLEILSRDGLFDGSIDRSYIEMIKNLFEKEVSK